MKGILTPWSVALLDTIDSEEGGWSGWDGETFEDLKDRFTLILVGLALDLIGRFAYVLEDFDVVDGLRYPILHETMHS